MPSGKLIMWMVAISLATNIALARVQGSPKAAKVVGLRGAA